MTFFSGDKRVGASAGKRRGANLQESAVTILTSGCHFSGKLYCKGSSRIGGRIEGEIISEGLLIIEEGATIHANVKAEETILHVRFNGRLEASVKVEFAETASFEGELQTPSLLVNEGAQFNGRVVMSPALSGVEELHKKKLNHKDIVVPDISMSK